MEAPTIRIRRPSQEDALQSAMTATIPQLFRQTRELRVTVEHVKQDAEAMKLRMCREMDRIAAQLAKHLETRVEDIVYRRVAMPEGFPELLRIVDDVCDFAEGPLWGVPEVTAELVPNYGQPQVVVASGTVKKHCPSPTPAKGSPLSQNLRSAADICSAVKLRVTRLHSLEGSVLYPLEAAKDALVLAGRWKHDCNETAKAAETSPGRPIAPTVATTGAQLCHPLVASVDALLLELGTVKDSLALLRQQPTMTVTNAAMPSARGGHTLKKRQAVLDSNVAEAKGAEEEDAGRREEGNPSSSRKARLPMLVLQVSRQGTVVRSTPPGSPTAASLKTAAEAKLRRVIHREAALESKQKLAALFKRQGRGSSGCAEEGDNDPLNSVGSVLAGDDDATFPSLFNGKSNGSRRPPQQTVEPSTSAMLLVHSATPQPSRTTMVGFGRFTAPTDPARAIGRTRRLMRQRTKATTQRLTQFVHSVQHEVAMAGVAGNRSRAEAEANRRDIVATLQPTIQSSMATLNSTSRVVAEAAEQPAEDRSPAARNSDWLQEQQLQLADHPANRVFARVLKRATAEEKKWHPPS